MGKKIKNEKQPLVLIVDDKVENLQVLGSILKSENYKVAVATGGNQAIAIANEINPDLILLDVMMPDINGFETCKNLKNLPLTREIPVIFLTAKVEKEDMIEGFKMGAVDYITKPFNSYELKARVKTHVELKISRDLLKQQNEILERLSTTDGLTGLYNQRYASGLLARLVEENSRYGQPLSIAILDIDNFKEINDFYGHIFGDGVLTKIASMIEDSLRKTDVAGRYGGDEFLIIFAHTNLDGAAESVKRIVNNTEKLKWDDNNLKITLSAGVCQRKDEDTMELIKKADNLLYAAKKKGKNMAEF